MATRAGDAIADCVEHSADEQVQDHTAASADGSVTVQRQRSQRHSKRVSLNFPIAVAAPATSSPFKIASPLPDQSVQNDHGDPGSFKPIQDYRTPGSHIARRSLPPTPPSETSEDNLPSQGHPYRWKVHTRSHTVSANQIFQTTSSTDFLTLVASQERRVLDLKEELSRAESELQALKKRWAIHETGRKKSELKNAGTVKMTPLSHSAVAPSTTAAALQHNRALSTTAGTAVVGLGLAPIDEPAESLDKDTAREARIQQLARRGTMESALAGRRTGQRVFSSSRHVRTLSLLTTSNLDIAAGPKTSIEAPTQPRVSLEQAPASSLESGPPIYRLFDDFATPTHSAAGLIRSSSPRDRLDQLGQLNLGKTYKDLAQSATRSTIPSHLVKHGKVVVDGVKEGLWNFLEDIRQATVGEEALREARSRGEALTKSGVRPSTTVRNKAEEDREQSFWREFGVDTPRADKTRKAGRAGRKQADSSRAAPSTTLAEPNQHTPPSSSCHSPLASVPGAGQDKVKAEEKHTSKSSTDSRDSCNPPSLLDDAPGEEEDEGWEWGEVEGPVKTLERTPFHKTASVVDTEKAPGIDWHDLTS